MPTFATPQPISVTIELVAGAIRIAASDRDDTVVNVRPSDPSEDPDVRAAGLTRVDYQGGRLLVMAPKSRVLGMFGNPGSIDLTIELPADSHLQCTASLATDFRCEGRLGDCRVKLGAGQLHIERSQTLDVTTGGGTINVEHVAGNAHVSIGSGMVRLGEIHGSATIKNSNGESSIGVITGDLRVSAANGGISVEHPGADVSASTANGDVRIGDLVQGSTSLKTSRGQIDVGIHAGTAARLDVHTSFGRVRNHLDSAQSPEPSDKTADVHARTSFGNVVIRRS